MMTYMMNKRTYIKPKCLLLDDEIQSTLLNGSLWGTEIVGENGQETGQTGPGVGDNDKPIGARQDFFDEDGW